MSMVTGAPGVVTGTPKPADNTGRDWTEGAEIGLSTAGAIVGSILSFGTASAPLIATSAALDAAAIGARAYQDVQQNAQDAKSQQRQLQAQLDAHQVQATQGGQVPKPDAILKNSAQPMPGAQVNPVQVNANLGQQLQGFKSPVEQAPTAIDIKPQDAPTFTGAPNQDFTNEMGGPIGGVSGTAIPASTFQTSDRRTKTKITSGNADAQDFLAMARAQCWPKGTK